MNTTAPRELAEPSPGAWREAIWAVTAAFGVYFCTYAFRKPFTAATYEGDWAWGIDYKTALVTAQVLGYAASKFIGIKVVAETKPTQRVVRLLGLIGCAQLSLLLFAMLPAPWNALAMFTNGLSLGMAFGLVLGFLEGRCLTEALSAGLCASFILADGAMKSVGAWLVQAGIPLPWMPAVAGLLFLLPLLLFAWMLRQIPAPTVRDVAQRSERPAMIAADRWRFLSKYGLGIAPLLVMYLLVTILRSLRADFAPEIWSGLGYSKQPSVFFQSEIFVAIGVLIINGLSVLIFDNRRAFFLSLLVSQMGLVLVAIALVLQRWQPGNGFLLMVLLGFGLYVPYVAVHTTIFERLIALTRDRANLGYLMYLADAIGYLGYVAVMLGKSTIAPGRNMFAFFLGCSWVVVVLGCLCLVLCWAYFRRYALASGSISDVVSLKVAAK